MIELFLCNLPMLIAVDHLENRLELISNLASTRQGRGAIGKDGTMKANMGEMGFFSYSASCCRWCWFEYQHMVTYIINFLGTKYSKILFISLYTKKVLNRIVGIVGDLLSLRKLV